MAGTLETRTLFVSDVVGSSQMWEREPAAMRVALTRHDQLLRSAIENAQGHVFKTAGDAFFATFPTTALAVQAALDAQIAIAAEAWPTSNPIAVRTAIHIGVVEPREGDFFGPAMNRIARLLSSGHGGQVLLTQAAYELVRDSLPEGASLDELGEYRLRDLARPERVYQLSHKGLAAHFPALKTLDTLPNNLPLQLSSFVGREIEISEVENLLSEFRLVSILGPGGAGKTRIALQIAAALLDRFPDGVWFVQLESTSDPAAVPIAVAEAVGAREQPGRTLRSSLLAALREKNLLILLDNCEHLVESCADLVDDLLQGCPSVRVVCTSREPLNIPGERKFRLPSLGIPDAGGSFTVEVLEQYEAVRLFIDRAISVEPGFQVTNENAPAVASICAKLDGIPLAIELAVARLRSLSVSQIDTRLADRFRLLSVGKRTALPRQQTLQATIDWSHDLLSEPERILFRRLSAFSGGWMIEEAERVAGFGELSPLDVLDALDLLVDKSLVTRRLFGKQTRFGFLETIREYSTRRLEDSGEADELRDRHMAVFAELAHQHGPKVRAATDGWSLERFSIEHDNLRAALARAFLSHVSDPIALQMVGDLGFFFHARGFAAEGLGWTLKAMELPSAQTSPERPRVLKTAANLAFQRREVAIAMSSAMELLETSGDNDRAYACNVIGLLYGQVLHHPETAVEFYRRGLEYDDAAPSEGLRVHLLTNWAQSERRRGSPDLAKDLVLKAQELARGLKSRREATVALLLLGILAVDANELERAGPLFEQALEEGSQVGDLIARMDTFQWMAIVRLSLGDAIFAERRLDEAKALLPIDRISPVAAIERQILDGLIWLAKDEYRAALVALSQAAQRAYESHNPVFLSTACIYAAIPMAELGMSSEAARILGLAVELRRKEGSAPTPFWQAWLDRAIKKVGAETGPELLETCADEARAAFADVTRERDDLDRASTILMAALPQVSGNASPPERPWENGSKL